MPTKTLTKTTPASPLWSSPLKTADGRVFPSHGKRVCAWIERNCLYGEGDWYGEPVRLRAFQKRFIYRLYEYDPDTGIRRYRRALLGMGKGNGKTPLASWVGAYELAGGQSISPRVIIGAASLKQANLVFSDLKTTMLGTDAQPSPLRPFVEPFDLQILLKDRPGLAERIAAEAGTNDGARATAFIADELHEWLGRVGRVYMVVDGAIAKRRNAFSLGITTAGARSERDPDGRATEILEQLYEHGVACAKGERVDDTFLFEWYEAPPCDLDDPDQWLAAILTANPAAGDFNDIDSLRSRFERMPRHEFERYHLNRWTAVFNRWIEMERWDVCSEPPEIEEGERVYVGVDGAAKRDTTAVYIVKIDSERRVHVFGQVFEPPGEGEVIDPELVENHIRDVCRTYEVAEVAFDPALFYRSAQLLAEEGYPMVEVPQTVPRKMQFAQALWDAVNEGRVRHGGDPTLRAHVDGAVAKYRGNGWTIEKGQASRRIDAVIAVAMAVQRAEESGGGEPMFTVIEF
jgi:phage terminase large subunit-like protein